MGLLDGIFGKEEINQLKKQLVEKTDIISKVESQLAELIRVRISLEGDLANFQKIVSGKNSSIQTLNENLSDYKNQRDGLSTELEKNNQSLIAFRLKSESDINEANLKIEEAQAALQQAKNKSNLEEKKLAELQLKINEKHVEFSEREKKLAEKSDKLYLERQKFQQQATELYAREQRWKNNVEPQLARYESHQTLDARKKELEKFQSDLHVEKEDLKIFELDLAGRDCFDERLKFRENELEKLSEQVKIRESEADKVSASLKNHEVELKSRQKKLDDWARELAQFQQRINQIDQEEKNLNSRVLALQAKEAIQKETYSKRLTEIRKQRSINQKLDQELTSRETLVYAREQKLTREEAKVLAIKESNKSLKYEVIQFSELINDLTNEKNELTRLGKKDRLQLEKLKSQMANLEVSTTTLSKFQSSLSNPIVLAWMLGEGDPDSMGIENGWLGISGNGPWPDQVYESNLKDIGYSIYPLPDSDLKHLIVGRKAWSKSDLLSQIDASQGKILRIYSQEMFFAKLVTGKDPFDSQDKSLLDAFAEDHPALKFLMTLPDRWPEVTSLENEVIRPVDEGDFGVSESPLRILGYKVGSSSSLSVAERRKIISQCFEAKQLDFSDDSSQDYITNWGRASGAQRLYRIAIHLKSQADGRSGMRSPQARHDWSSDLKWLKTKYYSIFNTKFTWPDY
jgi:hypothetical protein